MLRTGGWDEEAGISQVQSGFVVGFPDEVGAGAELAFVVKVGVEAVVAQAIIEGELVGDFPFILEINAGFENAVAVVVGDGKGHI